MRIQQLRGVLNRNFSQESLNQSIQSLTISNKLIKCANFHKNKTSQTERIFLHLTIVFVHSVIILELDKHYQHQKEQDQTFETFRRPIPDPNMVVVAVVALDLHRRLVHLINNC